MRKSSWKLCAVCQEEFPSITAKICQDCKQRAQARGYNTPDIDTAYVMKYGKFNDKTGYLLAGHPLKKE